ncbi:response regulator [Ottowia sp. VDI28]|uniref:response regulator n=1 Tax=Ottowia sp. VDI28 TaxID=3133968 RepID=UPI003C2CA62D
MTIVKNANAVHEHMSNNEVQPPHILIIDDDPDQLRLLVAALRNTPYRVSVALNGDQGYARATVLLPDLILLDVRMPGRNGITIARLLKTNPSTQHIPILILSALNDEHERLAGLRAGAVDFISKPFLSMKCSSGHASTWHSHREKHPLPWTKRLPIMVKARPTRQLRCPPISC